MLVAVSYQYPYHKKPELGIHKCMWKADFGTVDGAIASCFDYSEQICVLRIEYYIADRILRAIQSVNCLNSW
jgi:hypothetical protein